MWTIWSANSQLFTKNESEALKRRFEVLDRNSVGLITVNDIKMLPELAVNPIADLIVKVMFPTDSSISFHDFCQFLGPFRATATRDEKLQFAFKIYDIDEDGKISVDDLTTVFGQMVGNAMQNKAEEMAISTIKEFDYDGDLCLSFSEFKAALFNCPVHQLLSITF